MSARVVALAFLVSALTILANLGGLHSLEFCMTVASNPSLQPMQAAEFKR